MMEHDALFFAAVFVIAAFGVGGVFALLCLATNGFAVAFKGQSKSHPHL